MKVNLAICEDAEPITLTIDESGQLEFVHDDRLTELLDEGDAHIRRVSHVEPRESVTHLPEKLGLRWVADMSPVNGPVLGPFRTRAEALKAERRWLSRHYFHDEELLA